MIFSVFRKLKAQLRLTVINASIQTDKILNLGEYALGYVNLWLPALVRFALNNVMTS